MSIDEKTASHFLLNPFRNADSVTGVLNLIQQNAELVPSEPGDHSAVAGHIRSPFGPGETHYGVVSSNRSDEPIRDIDQKPIAGAVA